MHAAREVLYEYTSVLPVYLHAQRIHNHFNLAGKERELLALLGAVVVIMQPLCVLIYCMSVCDTLD